MCRATGRGCYQVKLDFTRETALEIVAQFVEVKLCTDAPDWSADTELMEAGITAAAMLDACEDTELRDAGFSAAAREDACDDTEFSDATTIAAASEDACTEVDSTEAGALICVSTDHALVASSCAVEVAELVAAACDLTAPFTSSASKP